MCVKDPALSLQAQSQKENEEGPVLRGSKESRENKKNANHPDEIC